MDKHPDCEIIEWNESNFPMQAEFDKCQFLDQCYREKLWAFVSDYMRVHVLNEYGGIYLDTDMFLVKALTPLQNQPCFLGFENEQAVNLAIAGSIAAHPLWADMLTFYRKDILSSDVYTIPAVATALLKSRYALITDGSDQLLTEDIRVYPSRFFYPYGYKEQFTMNCITTETYGIHWWSSSWHSKRAKLYLRTKHLVGWKKTMARLKIWVRI